MQDIRILIVEDEKKIADTVKQGLTEQGFQADATYDGEIGLKLFRSRTYNLVILDVNLPGMNGFELCRAIRQSNQAVPIVMLTAMSAVEDKIEAFDAGADDYIIKAPVYFFSKIIYIYIDHVCPGIKINVPDIK